MLLTASVPDDFRLVVFNGGVNDHSAAQTQSLALGAEGYLEFVNDGCLEGNAVLGAKTVCRREQKETRSENGVLHTAASFCSSCPAAQAGQAAILPI